MAEKTILWQCGSCNYCFADLEAHENHPCAQNRASNVTASEQFEEESCSQSNFANTAEQVETITAISELEQSDADFNNDIRGSVTFSSPAKKQQRKSKPTIISVGSHYGKKKLQKGLKAKRSLVWTYFHALDCKKAVCCVCHKVIAYCGTPTNLVYHLSRFHPNESAVIKSKQTGRAKYQYLENKLPKPSDAAMKIKSHQNIIKANNIMTAAIWVKKTVTDKLVDFLVLDLQPVTILHGEGFQELIHSFEPSCKIPEPKKMLKDFIPKRYYAEFKKVQNFIANSDKVQLSIELWTGYNDGAFISITSHFVNDDFDFKCYTLNTSFLGKAQTPQNITTALLSCISDWNITTNTMCIVTDGSENVIKAVKLTGWKHITCLAHTLNSIIKESFAASPEMNKLIEKCCNLVLYLKHNDLARQKLMEIQTQDKQMQNLLREHVEFADSKTPNCPLKAKKHVPSQWITMFHMLQRIFTLRNVITIVLDYVPSTAHVLTDNEWLAIEETISLLKAFEVVTLELCSERFPLLSKVIPVVQGLLSLVNNCTSLTLNFVERVRTDLYAQLTRRLGRVEHNVILAMSTMLDPRFKNIAFQSESAVDAAILAISEDGTKYLKPNSCISLEKQGLGKNISSYTDSLWECFDKKATPKKELYSDDDVIINEIKLFFDEPVIDRKRDPIVWWKDQGATRFPILAQIAKEMLSIPSTSMPPERVFLQKGQLFDEKRKLIKTKYVDQFLFLNANIE